MNSKLTDSIYFVSTKIKIFQLCPLFHGMTQKCLQFLHPFLTGKINDTISFFVKEINPVFELIHVQVITIITGEGIPTLYNHFRNHRTGTEITHTRTYITRAI